MNRSEFLAIFVRFQPNPVGPYEYSNTIVPAYRDCIVERNELDNKFTNFHESKKLSVRGNSWDAWSV